MAKTSKKISYSERTLKDLAEELKEKEKGLLDTKIEVSTRKIKNVHAIGKIKKEIARIRTAIAARRPEV